MKKNSFIIHWTIYPYDVLVCIGMTTEEVIKRIEKIGYELNESEKELLPMLGLGRTVTLESGQTIIQLKGYSEKIIAHEAFHAVHNLAEIIGLKLSYDSDEAYAYAIDYLVGEINKSIKRRVII